MKIFITDAAYKHTLGAVRSLGKKGYHIIAGSPTAFSQAQFSKYCSERVRYPDPRTEKEFMNFILNYLRNREIDVLLPIGYFTTTVFSKHKKQLTKHTKVPIANWSSMEIACNKDKTMAFASSVGIKMPRLYETPEEIESFPIVAKGIRESGSVRYVNSAKELAKIKTKESIFQEYIPGDGYGFYALFNRGKLRAFFMHKRLREFPITGGASTAAESIFDPKLKATGEKLLKKLSWHGVAMAEFKKDARDGEYKLMEINPKFWGSLDLSLASGVNFPYLTVKMALDGDVKPVSKYKVGVRFRWLLPDDVKHVLAKPEAAKVFIHDLFDKNTKGNVWLGDIKPNICQFITTLPIILRRLKSKDFRYPHGIPKVSN